MYSLQLYIAQAAVISHTRFYLDAMEDTVRMLLDLSGDELLQWAEALAVSISTYANDPKCCAVCFSLVVNHIVEDRRKLRMLRRSCCADNTQDPLKVELR